jgi:hypothetical protein
MNVMPMIAATLGVMVLGGCATFATGYPHEGYYFHDM